MIRRCLLLATIVLMVSAPTAAACSCAMFDPDRIDEADAAVVGTVVDVDPQPGGKSTRMRVERSLDDAIERGELIDVDSSHGGGTCGLELDVGDRAGLLLQEDGDGWSGSLCATTSAARLSVELDKRNPVPGLVGSIAIFVSAVVAHIEDAPMRYRQSAAYLEAAAASDTSDVASLEPVGDPPCLRRA